MIRPALGCRCFGSVLNLPLIIPQDVFQRRAVFHRCFPFDPYQLPGNIEIEHLTDISPAPAYYLPEDCRKAQSRYFIGVDCPIGFIVHLDDVSVSIKSKLLASPLSSGINFPDQSSSRYMLIVKIDFPYTIAVDMEITVFAFYDLVRRAFPSMKLPEMSASV